MNTEKRRHLPEFKATVALEAIKGKFTVAELAERYGVNPSLIHSWKKVVLDGAARLMMTGGRGLDTVIEERKDKEKQLERLRTENEWLQKVLLRLSPNERKAAVETGNSQLPLLRQVKLLEVNRSSIYYRKRIESEQEHRIAT